MHLIVPLPFTLCSFRPLLTLVMNRFRRTRPCHVTHRTHRLSSFLSSSFILVVLSRSFGVYPFFVIHTRCFRRSSLPRYIVCSYRVHPHHRTYSPRSHSSVLATECTRHRVIRPRHTHTRYGVVHLGSTHFCRHSHSLCLSSPPRHNICFRRSPPLSSSLPHHLRFRPIFACIDGDPSFASSVVILPRIRFLTPQDLPLPDSNMSSPVLASSCLLRVFVVPSSAHARFRPCVHPCGNLSCSR